MTTREPKQNGAHAKVEVTWADVATDSDERADEAPAPPTAPASAIVGRVLSRIAEAELALATLLAEPAPSAGPDASAELVHDYRVALRRLRSILRMVEPAYGKRRVRKLADRIRDAALVTGDLRDEEVLRETLTELKLAPATLEPLGHWMRGRARRERGLRSRVLRTIRAGAAHDAADGVAPTLAKLKDRLSGAPKHAIADEVVAREGLTRVFTQLRERAALAKSEDVPSMHELRIVFKKVRYTIEIIEGLAPPIGWEPRAESLAAKMQKHLGKLHDLDEALVRMERARGLEPTARREVLDELARERKKTAAKCERDAAAAMKELEPLLAGPLTPPDPETGDPRAPSEDEAK